MSYNSLDLTPRNKSWDLFPSSALFSVFPCLMHCFDGFLFDCHMDWTKSCPLIQTWNYLGPANFPKVSSGFNSCFLKDYPVSSVILTPPIWQTHPESYCYTSLGYVQIYMPDTLDSDHCSAQTATVAPYYTFLVQKLRNFPNNTVRNCFDICFSKPKYVGTHFLFSILSLCLFMLR